MGDNEPYRSDAGDRACLHDEACFKEGFHNPSTEHACGTCDAHRGRHVSSLFSSQTAVQLYRNRHGLGVTVWTVVYIRSDSATVAYHFRGGMLL